MKPSNYVKQFLESRKGGERLDLLAVWLGFFAGIALGFLYSTLVGCLSVESLRSKCPDFNARLLEYKAWESSR